MRRPLAGFFALCSVLALACTETTIVKQNAETPTDGGPVDPELDGGPAEPDAAPPKPPGDPLMVDLGEVTTGTEVTFDVPAGALGFNIVAECDPADFDQDNPFGIQRITDPTGRVVHDDFTPDGGTKPTSTAAFDTIASASVPQSENVPTVVPSGKWKVLFGVENKPTSKLKLQAHVRVQSSGDGAFHGGTLDLTIHTPPGLKVDGAVVDPSKASTNAGIEERIAIFFQATKQLLGIERGKITYRPAKASLVDCDDNEILDGFAVSVGETDGAQNMHILLSNSIRSQGQEVAIGISPGIPGAAGVFGRGVSGIIVVPGGQAQDDALTIIHEFGHFIGLNHTTEFDGQSSDPLADTPRCPASTIQQQKLQSCPDRTNVMFAAGAIDGPVSLSPTQTRVYHGSPIFKALTTTKASGTMGLHAPLVARRSYRTSGRALGAVERELSSGFCGLSLPDAKGMAARHGRAATIAQLRAAAADADLAPYIRGRANLALAQLGAR
jgi:Pregnancy-associated plasma protein-A